MFSPGFTTLPYLGTALVLEVHESRAPGAGGEDHLVGEVLGAVLRLDADAGRPVVREQRSLERPGAALEQMSATP